MSKNKKGRFSAYCLEVGDSYLGDCIADYYAPSASASDILANEKLPSLENFHQASWRSGGSEGALRGQLRLGSSSVYFEPDDVNEPIRTFKFKDCIKQQHHLSKIVSSNTDGSPGGGVGGRGSGMSPTSPSRGGGAFSEHTGNPQYTYFGLRCDSLALQLIGGEQHPWKNVKSPTPNAYHCFCLPYPEKGDALLAELGSLLSLERMDAGAEEKKEVIQQWRLELERQTPFSLTNLKSRSSADGEKVLVEQWCNKVDPLATHRGRLVVSSKHIYFQQLTPIQPPQVSNVPLEMIRRVERRIIRVDDVGLEIHSLGGSDTGSRRNRSSAAGGGSGATSSTELLFEFTDPTSRDIVFHALAGHPTIEKFRRSTSKLEAMTQRWVKGQLSTFDYLMVLNWESGRSLNDLSQYPFLPWIFDFSNPAVAQGKQVPDVTSSSGSATNNGMFRDLTKPIGALNAKRIAELEERAGHLKEMGEEPYLYGTHFSTPAYITYFLVREQPELMIALQGGRMDHGSRMFDTLTGTWAGITSQSSADLKELIPQFFFGTGSFLEETAVVDLGVKSDGCRVKANVELPPWAKSAQHFIEVHRAALEGPHVSKHIHAWIDLMFGFKQGQGATAWHAQNVFHPYSYARNEGSSKLRDVPPEVIDAHVREFGQMPKRLFDAPHPLRQVTSTCQEAINLGSIMPPDALAELFEQEEETEQQHSSLKPQESHQTPKKNSTLPKSSSVDGSVSAWDDAQPKSASASFGSTPSGWGNSASGMTSGTIGGAGKQKSALEEELDAMKETLEKAALEEEKEKEAAKIEHLDLKLTSPNLTGSPTGNTNSNQQQFAKATESKVRFLPHAALKSFKASSKAVSTVFIQNMVPDDTTWCFEEDDVDEAPAVAGNNCGGVVDGEEDEGDEPQAAAAAHILPSLFIFAADVGGKVAVLSSKSGKKIRDVAGNLGSVALTSQTSSIECAGGRKGGARILLGSLSGGLVAVDPHGCSCVSEKEVSTAGVQSVCIVTPFANTTLLACGCVDGEAKVFGLRKTGGKASGFAGGGAKSTVPGLDLKEFSRSPITEGYGEGPVVSWCCDPSSSSSDSTTVKLYAITERDTLLIFDCRDVAGGSGGGTDDEDEDDFDDGDGELPVELFDALEMEGLGKLGIPKLLLTNSNPNKNESGHLVLFTSTHCCLVDTSVGSISRTKPWVSILCSQNDEVAAVCHLAATSHTQAEFVPYVLVATVNTASNAATLHLVDIAAWVEVNHYTIPSSSPVQLPIALTSTVVEAADCPMAVITIGDAAGTVLLTALTVTR